MMTLYFGTLHNVKGFISIYTTCTETCTDLEIDFKNINLTVFHISSKKYLALNISIPLVFPSDLQSFEHYVK